MIFRWYCSARNVSVRLSVVLVWCAFFGIGLCEEDINSLDNEINRVEISSEANPSSTALAITESTIIKDKKQDEKRLVCPGKETRVPFFALPCRTARDCSFLGPNLVCCNRRCIRGVKPPKPEPSHSPLFGVIDRVCPTDPMPELLAIQECIVDDDCGPRICCPERSVPGVESKSYCRNAAPRFTRMPAVRQVLLPLKSFASYLQCTPPPPPFLDLFPKPCESVLDCFPSLCCQENGKKVCRPPRKSLLTLVASAAQRIGTSALAKSFIQRISK